MTKTDYSWGPSNCTYAVLLWPKWAAFALHENALPKRDSWWYLKTWWHSNACAIDTSEVHDKLLVWGANLSSDVNTRYLSWFFFFFGFHMPFMLPRVIISTAGSNVATVESLGFCVICALAVTAITSASPNRYERLNEATSTDSLALEMLVFSSLRGYWQDLRNISIELLCFFSWISIAALVVENVHATSAKPV